MLSQFLLSQIFAFMLIFCRTGSSLMVLPGFGESYVSPRLRLTLALAFALVLVPVLGKSLPPVPNSIFALAVLILQEIVVGIFIGVVVNIITSAMHMTGMIMSFQAGLSSAVLFDPSQATQGTVIGNFLGIIALTLMFALDLHHLMLQGLVDSYTLFVPGHAPPLGDFAETVSTIVSRTFMLALKLAAPLIVSGLLLSLAAGILSRLMPIMPVFFIITAPQMLIGFFIIVISLSGLMLLYIQFLEETLKGLF